MLDLILARPFEIRSIVEKSPYTRTGSNVLMIVEALESLIFSVA